MKEAVYGRFEAERKVKTCLPHHDGEQDQHCARKKTPAAALSQKDDPQRHGSERLERIESGAARPCPFALRKTKKQGTSVSYARREREERVFATENIIIGT